MGGFSEGGFWGRVGSTLKLGSGCLPGGVRGSGFDPQIGPRCLLGGRFLGIGGWWVTPKFYDACRLEPRFQAKKNSLPAWEVPMFRKISFSMLFHYLPFFPLSSIFMNRKKLERLDIFNFSVFECAFVFQGFSFPLRENRFVWIIFWDFERMEKTDFLIF